MTEKTAISVVFRRTKTPGFMLLDFYMLLAKQLVATCVRKCDVFGGLSVFVLVDAR